jgi:hypothetical protein
LFNTGQVVHGSSSATTKEVILTIEKSGQQSFPQTQTYDDGSFSGTLQLVSVDYPVRDTVTKTTTQISSNYYNYSGNPPTSGTPSYVNTSYYDRLANQTHTIRMNRYKTEWYGNIKTSTSSNTYESRHDGVNYDPRYHTRLGYMSVSSGTYNFYGGTYSFDAYPQMPHDYYPPNTFPMGGSTLGWNSGMYVGRNWGSGLQHYTQYQSLNQAVDNTPYFVSENGRINYWRKPVNLYYRQVKTTTSQTRRVQSYYSGTIQLVDSVATYKGMVERQVTPVKGFVDHTDQWEVNRQRYNAWAIGNGESTRQKNLFFRGENFMLSTQTDLEADKVYVQIDAYPNLNTWLSYNNQDGAWKWRGEIKGNSMIDWSSQPLTFVFTSYAGTETTTDRVTVFIDTNEYYRLNQLF